jgi:hypothetical protein
MKHPDPASVNFFPHDGCKAVSMENRLSKTFQEIPFLTATGGELCLSELIAHGHTAGTKALYILSSYFFLPTLPLSSIFSESRKCPPLHLRADAERTGRTYEEVPNAGKKKNEGIQIRTGVAVYLLRRHRAVVPLNPVTMDRIQMSVFPVSVIRALMRAPGCRSILAPAGSGLPAAMLGFAEMR